MGDDSAIQRSAKPSKPVTLQVIGMGVVGKALTNTLRNMGCTVCVKDRDYGMVSKDAEVYFICTHESDVEIVLRETELPIGKPIAIKSTMTPATFQGLRKKFPKLHLCAFPEFLRQKTAFTDCAHPEFHVIGECCIAHGDLLEEIFKVQGCPIVRTSPANALMIKLAHNAFLASLISFWNEITMICGESAYLVAKSCTLSSRIPKYGTDRLGSAFDGHCLPKDLTQLIEYAEQNRVNPRLLKAVRMVNECACASSLQLKAFTRKSGSVTSPTTDTMFTSSALRKPP